MRYPRRWLALALTLGLALAPPGAAALGLGLAAGEPALGLDDPDLINLDQTAGYTISFSGSLVPGFSGAVGNRLNVTGTFTVKPVESAPELPIGALLVFTSIRRSGPLQCSSGEGGSGLPPLAPFAIVPGSFSGIDGLIEVSDPLGPGTLCDEEGTQFLAAGFDGRPTARQFGFQLEVTSPVSLPGGLQFQILNDAYAIVPEPATLALVLGGLGALAARGRVF